LSSPYAYIDSSALVKLAIEEPGTTALQADIATRAGLMCSSIGATELIRACRRSLSRKQMARVDEILDAIFLLYVTPAILSEAAALSPTSLRTFDAIHVATILSIDERPLDVITYDSRLAVAATSHGFTVVSP
jgi:uncharacterized protein